MSGADAHYAGELVDGAHMLTLFGDVATELAIASDGDEGLFRTYEHIDFLAPVYAGDYIEAKGWYIKVGETSRTMQFEAWKVISLARDGGLASAADILPQPILVCKAIGIGVIPKAARRPSFMSPQAMVINDK
jgi:acyl-CoA hydrolase